MLKNNPQNAMMVALTLYLVKIGVLLVLLLVLQDATFFAPKVFAAVIVACTLAWTFVEVWIFSRTQVLYVDPAGSPTSAGPESGGAEVTAPGAARTGSGWYRSGARRRTVSMDDARRMSNSAWVNSSRLITGLILYTGLGWLVSQVGRSPGAPDGRSGRWSDWHCRTT